MSPYRTVLVPVHLGESAPILCAQAARLAGALGAEVVLLAMVDRLVPDPDALTTQQLAAIHPAPEVTLEMNALLRGFRSAGVAARTLVRQGAVAPGILAAIQEANADLVIMGTHARTGLQELVLGSVARQVVRDSTVPVTLVRTTA